ncbi:MAG: ABC transporter ATP-binding protein [Phycisphaerales bacterium]
MDRDAAEPGIAVECTAVRFAYPGSRAFALEIPRFEADRGALTALIGPSGSGKSTLLDLLAGRLVPISGRISIAGEPISTLPAHRRRRFRLTRIGDIAQTLALVGHLTALENILLVAIVAGVRPLPVERARTLAAQLGVEPLLRRRPQKLSQGERQRIAICRALLLEPELLLCDEPTGNLDPSRSRATTELLIRAARERGVAVVMSTHDHSLLDLADRVYDAADFRPCGGTDG